MPGFTPGGVAPPMDCMSKKIDILDSIKAGKSLKVKDN
uniref:Uncharacterized protein n=1 Tax=Lepeophtheirus salmonis TaxID=72036 RepID=A0A0K2VLF1_LEPSM